MENATSFRVHDKIENAVFAIHIVVKQSSGLEEQCQKSLNCFVAALLAKTEFLLLRPAACMQDPVVAARSWIPLTSRGT